MLMLDTSIFHFQGLDPNLLDLQASMSQLIYRYLASEEGTESADRKTRLLLSLVQHIHTAAHIMQRRTRRNQKSNQPLPPTSIPATGSSVIIGTPS